MPKRVVDLRGQQTPLLDVASYGRRGPGHRPLTKAQIEHVSRTVRRVPEVVIKVSGGARTLRGVQAHLDYIGRKGKGEVETDDGARLRERGFEKDLVKDWDLDLDVPRYTARAIAAGRRPPKLVHNLVFSMPRGTPPEKLLKAVRTFAREKFALQHRYALALHTDQGHPHVHVVVKAESEQGVRLNIRKATLREWRRDFAQYLRELGVEANATERAVRGKHESSKLDGVYWAERRGASRHTREHVEGITHELLRRNLRVEVGKAKLLETRNEVQKGWRAVSEILVVEGHPELAAQVREFAARMPPPRTDREVIAEQLLEPVRRARAREGPTR
jgi:type IV secretory pathway VirD2 relaxase